MRTKLIAATCLFTLTACASADSDDSGDGGGSTGMMASEDSGTAAMTAGASEDTTGAADTQDPMGSSSAAMDDGSTGAGVELDCATYCGIYLEACVDFTEYANEQECMDQCGQWPVGAVEDTENDSLGCRIYHATVAGSAAADLHCPHAGPSGAATCVDAGAPNCADYCDTYFDNCTGDINVYADLEDCMTQCAPWYPGTMGDTAGNTIGCRTYHAGAPAVGDPQLHCPHAAPGGGGVCVFP